MRTGASTDVQGDTGVTPLWLAAYNGHLDCVNILIASGKSSTQKKGLRIFPLDYHREYQKKWCFQSTLQELILARKEGFQANH